MRSFDERQVIKAADAIKRRERKARKEARPAPVKPTAAGQRDPRDEDRAYMAWLHQGIPCTACLIEGRPGAATRVRQNPIEAAHQKLAIASAGWKEGGGGKRTSDSRCIPLCRWHHQDAPNACDKGQRMFWDRLGLGDRIADLCKGLHATYRNQGDGAAFIRRYLKENLR
jgi:hypothetical protein